MECSSVLGYLTVLVSILSILNSFILLGCSSVLDCVSLSGCFWSTSNCFYFGLLVTYGLFSSFKMSTCIGQFVIFRSFLCVWLFFSYNNVSAVHQFGLFLTFGFLNLGYFFYFGLFVTCGIFIRFGLFVTVVGHLSVLGYSPVLTSLSASRRFILLGCSSVLGCMSLLGCF